MTYNVFSGTLNPTHSLTHRTHLCTFAYISYFFSLLSLEFAMFTIVQRLAHREFVRELHK